MTSSVKKNWCAFQNISQKRTNYVFLPIAYLQWSKSIDVLQILIKFLFQHFPPKCCWLTNLFILLSTYCNRSNLIKVNIWLHFLRVEQFILFGLWIMIGARCCTWKWWSWASCFMFLGLFGHLELSSLGLWIEI